MDTIITITTIITIKIKIPSSNDGIFVLMSENKLFGFRIKAKIEHRYKGYGTSHGEDGDDGEYLSQKSVSYSGERRATDRSR